MRRDVTIDDIVAGFLLALIHAPRDDDQIKPSGFATPLRFYNVSNTRPNS